MYLCLDLYLHKKYRRIYITIAKRIIAAFPIIEEFADKLLLDYRPLTVYF